MRAFGWFGVACGLACAAVPVLGQSGATNGEWRHYGGDLGHTRYAPLDQIDATNFNKLEVAWRFKTDSLGPRPEFQYESTPLMIKGVVYTTAGTRRDVRSDTLRPRAVDSPCRQPVSAWLRAIAG